jgi:hypothetical protein
MHPTPSVDTNSLSALAFCASKMPRTQKCVSVYTESLSAPATAALKWTIERKAICVFRQCRLRQNVKTNNFISVEWRKVTSFILFIYSLFKDAVSVVNSQLEMTWKILPVSLRY